jgi:carotenoid cleavage dioxygenase-like enzyme
LTARQVHCIPRPGRAGKARPVYTAPPMFAFHHVNAYEDPSCDAIVIDTLARDTVDFSGDLRAFLTQTFGSAATKTTLRRLVCRGHRRRCAHHDLRRVPALDRVAEFAAPLPPACVGRPHRVAFCAVRAP